MIGIDFNYIINALVPPVHKIGEVLDYLKSAIKPLDQLKVNFYSFYDQVEYDLRFNGQVCSLEQFLNNKYDNVNRDIYITDAVNYSQVFLFNESEGNEQTYLFNNSEGADPTYLYNLSEVTQYDFIVNIPSAVVFNEDQLKFYVNKYKCAAKRWKIEII